MAKLDDRAARLLDAIWYAGNPLGRVLWPLGALYEGAAVARRRLYRRGFLRTEQLPVPVIVVGNISLGGTGKTPLIIWLARRLGERGYRVGIVCRGYGGEAKDWPREVDAASDAAEVGDEAVLLASSTRCPVFAAPDRVAAARQLTDRHSVDVILSDDGMQHYRLARDIELAAVDGTRGLGNGYCLPAGPLREPARRLREVDAIVVHEGDWGHAGVLRTRARVARVYELATGSEASIEQFRGRSVHAVAAIGNPDRFFTLLERHGVVVHDHAFRDHAALTRADLRFDDSDPVLITEKDAVKCRDDAPRGVWCVSIDLDFDKGDDERLMRMVMRQLEVDGAQG